MIYFIKKTLVFHLKKYIYNNILVALLADSSKLKFSFFLSQNYFMIQKIVFHTDFFIALILAMNVFPISCSSRKSLKQMHSNKGKSNEHAICIQSCTACNFNNDSADSQIIVSQIKENS